MTRGVVAAFATPCLLDGQAVSDRAFHVRRPFLAACACAGPPGDYDALREEAVAATKRALRAGVSLIELQFPPVANMATAALNQLLDQNREFTREFLRPFTPLHKPERINVVFPDHGEARLAQKTWGDVPFTLRSIPSKKEMGAPAFVRKSTAEGTSRTVEDAGLMVVVNPGFNISEWINMEALEGADPIVLINGDLDKVRGGYYPRIFYPGLHAVRDRFLSRFESVYYIKQFSNGGTLLRRYGEDWLLFYRNNVPNSCTTLLKSYPERPAFRLVEDDLRRQRAGDLRGS